MKKITLSYHIFFFCLVFLFPLSSIGQSTAIYNITFTNNWNETDHGPLPNNPHWSKLVGVNHNSNITFLEPGGIASQSIEDIAENGVNTNFENDVITSMTTGDSQQYIDGPSLFLSNGSTIEINGLQVSENFPLLTLVSMIAPSPDWMAFVNNLNLRNIDNTTWENSITINLYPYDAGTDSCTVYSGCDNDITPHVEISSLQGVSPFNTIKVATLEITLQSVLNTNDFNAIENIKIYPNPTKGNLSISNIQNASLKSIEIYTVLGKLARELRVENGISQLNIDASNLSKGLYLLKLNASGGKTKTQKLIIE